MNLLLVTYDLKAPNRNYDSLYSSLKSQGAWWHHLESTWIISTNETAGSFSAKLRDVIDENDNIFIVDITSRPRDGWLPKKAWEWLNEQGSR